MRLFLAQRAFIDDYKTLKTDFASCLEGRWRTAESLHATVVFLGDRFEAAAVIETVSALEFKLKDAVLDGVDRFSHNRIFYASARHRTLEHAWRLLTEAFGLPRHRPNIPHVTLMRYKNMETEKFALLKSRYDGKKIGTVSGPLILMNSTLLPTGAVYEPLHIFK